MTDEPRPETESARKGRQPAPKVGKARALSGKPEAPAIPTPDIGTPGADALPIQRGEVIDENLPAESPRLQALFDVAQTYGELSFENYAIIRNLAETLRDEFCAWLSETPNCVYLVPPEGRFSAKNYQSAAYSVAGKGYLPLKPISFGLAVKVSPDKDFMRLQMHCRKEGDAVFVRIEKQREMRVGIPLEEGALEPLFRAIYDYLTEYFQSRIDDYDHGRYGTTEIGFDIQRMTG